MRRHQVRSFGSALFIGLMFVAAGAFGRQPHPANATPVANENLGHRCYNVNDFGADPGGIVDSSSAFSAAFAAASIANGVAVCAPAGTYLVNNPILLYSPARSGSGGFSLYGAGPGVTVLLNTNQNAQNFQTQPYIFASCPDYSDVTPSMPTPLPSCPSVGSHAGGATPNPRVGLAGVTFANFSVDARPTLVPPNGVGASVFYFPSIHGLLVDNVSVTGSPTNIFDFGERLTNSFGGIVIRDGTVQTNYYGHYVALHGGGSGLVVDNTSTRGNQAAPQQGSGILFDTSDVVGQTVSDLHFRNNDFEGPFIGNFAFLPAATSGGTTVIKNVEWIGNIYDDCGFACYYFGAESGQVPAPVIQNVRLADRWAISDYDSIFLDGASYSNIGANAGGVQGIKVGGPSLYGSANSRHINMMPPQPLGGSIFMIEVPAPQVTVSPGAGVAVEFAGGATAVYTSNPMAMDISVNSVTVGLAQALVFTTSSLVSAAGSAEIANPSYGLVGITPKNGVLVAGSTPIPYTLVTSGNLRPLHATALCPLPAGLGTGVGFCVTGELDLGDGIAFRNGAHDIDIIGARVESPLGASIHIWPGGGNAFRILNDVLGEGHSHTSTTALQIDPDPAYSGNPSDYDVEGNDLVGATPIVAPLPTPSFRATSAPVMRNNRGALGVIIGPIMTGTTASLTIQNAGPLDCTYYFSAWTGTFATTVTLPGVASQSLVSGNPTSVFLPVGAALQASSVGSGSVTYVGFCQP